MQVTPLTALKFAELAAKAGIPKGVINIIPGSGNHTTAALPASCCICVCVHSFVHEWNFKALISKPRKV